MIFSDSSDGFSVEPWWKSEFLVADFVRYIVFLEVRSSGIYLLRFAVLQ